MATQSFNEFFKAQRKMSLQLAVSTGPQLRNTTLPSGRFQGRFSLSCTDTRQFLGRLSHLNSKPSRTTVSTPDRIHRLHSISLQPVLRTNKMPSFDNRNRQQQPTMTPTSSGDDGQHPRDDIHDLSKYSMPTDPEHREGGLNEIRKQQQSMQSEMNAQHQEDSTQTESQSQTRSQQQDR